MISEISSTAEEVNEEILALIETLLATEQRLEELTAGEMDSVAGRDGRTFLLRRGQEELRHSEAAKQSAILNGLRALLDVVPAMIWFKDTENGFLRVNQRGAEKSGRLVEEIEGKSAYEIFPEEAAGYYADDLEVIQSGTPKMGVVERLRGPKGEAVWIQTDKMPVFDKDGKVIGLVVLAQDITGRRRDEAALRESEERFAGAFEHAPIGVALVSPDGRWLKVNHALCDLVGYSEAELQTRTITDITHPEDVELSRESICRAIAGEFHSKQIEKRYIHKLGHVIAALLNISLVRDSQGQPQYFIAQIQDITERKRAKAALVASELRYHSLFENMLEGYAYCRALFEQDHLQDFIYLEVNSAFEKLTGLKQVAGKRVSEVIPGIRESNQGLFDIYGRVVLTGKPERFETYVEGLGIWLSITVYSPEKSHFVAVFDNITTRKQAEEALRTSEERFRLLAKATNDAIWDWDLATNSLWWNEGFEKQFGYRRDEVDPTVKSWTDCLHSEDMTRVTDGIHQVIEHGGEFWADEYRFRRQDGRYASVSDRGHIIRDGTGKAVRMVGGMQDITDRKEVAEALRTSEAEFRGLAEAMPQMVWITRADGWNTYFSRQWMDYTGLTLEESLGYGWTKPFHPEDQQRSREAWQHATATVGVYSVECRLRRADGAYRWWLIRGVPQLDATGNVLKWFGTCTDIHDLMLAELEISRSNEELRESEEKFRQLAASVTDVFYITSPDLREVHYVSPAYEQIWGRSTESLYANPYEWGEAILPEERADVVAAFSRLAADAPSLSIEFRIARPDGTLRWILSRGFLVRDAAGKAIRITGIASDITERKRLEAQLRQAQKMEAIGTLAGGIAHDFNNILAIIMGYSELALGGLSRDTRAHTHLEQVLVASTRARDLVRQILTFSRQEESERAVLQLPPIIDETLRLLRVSLPSTVEIRQNIDTTAPSVLGDATQIQQVTMNLCVNAMQAMKEGGGVLEVRLSSLDIDTRFASAHPELKEGPHICLTVSDTGCGLDRATQEHMFEPFFTTKPPGEGTGLGLAVVHGVVKNHGGAISIYSEPGVGTTFNIYLPVYDGPGAGVIRKGAPVRRGNGEHILLVDDEDALLTLGKSMLEHLGYRVTTRTDSVEALATFRSQPGEFELVITDLTMPHLDGAELTAALLEIRPSLPVILVTGYSGAMSPEQAKAIGIGELLSKPTTLRVLGEAINRALGESRKE